MTGALPPAPQGSFASDNAAGVSPEVTVDRALLAQYDSQIHDYYLARSSNNKVQTWSGQIKAILGKEARPFMLGFLQSKGFCLK